MKNKSMYAIVLSAALISASCTTAGLFAPRADQVLTAPEWETRRESVVLSPGKIVIECDLYEQEIRENARQSLSLLLDKQFEGRSAGEAVPGGTVDVRIREYSFMKNFRPVNSVSFYMAVYDPEENCLADYFYTEETRDSAFSSPYLYRQLERGFKKLF